MKFFDRFKKKKDVTSNKPIGFVDFITCDNINIDLSFLPKQIKDDWGIDIKTSSIDLNEDNSILVFNLDNMLVSFAAIPLPIPAEGLIDNAKTNYTWEDAVTVAKNHKSHIIVSVMGSGNSALDNGTLMVKMCTSCLKHPSATAINTLGSLFSPDYYISCATDSIKNGKVPTSNLIFIGLYPSSKNTESSLYCGYTFGMENFNKVDIEIIDSTQSPEEVYNFLYSISTYIISSDVTLNDGETIGFTADQKLKITYSDGVTLDTKTLKIEF